LFGNAQGIKVEYEAIPLNHASLILKLEGNAKYKDRMIQMEKKVNEVLSKIPFFVVANSKKYQFSYKEIIEKDGNQNLINLAISKVLEGESIFVDLKSESGYYSASDLPFIRKVSFNSVCWEITKESKYILGVKVYKAISTISNSESEYKMLVPNEAWFAPELSLKGGPTAYGSLPGLILELSTPAVTFKATDIKTGDFKVPLMEVNGKEIKTHEEFVAYYDEWNKKNMGRTN
tara:strand:+ start:61 stop:759 length:699 start_codon:yes stop_codon:yes gene_type:complete